MKPILVLILGMITAEGANMLFKLAVDRVQFKLDRGDLIGSVWPLFKSPFFLGGLASYAAGFLLWMLILAKYRYSDANLYFSLHYVLMLAVAVVVFKEQLTVVRCVGAGCIILGVALVGRS